MAGEMESLKSIRAEPWDEEKVWVFKRNPGRGRGGIRLDGLISVCRMLINCRRRQEKCFEDLVLSTNVTQNHLYYAQQTQPEPLPSWPAYLWEKMFSCWDGVIYTKERQGTAESGKVEGTVRMKLVIHRGNLKRKYEFRDREERTEIQELTL